METYAPRLVGFIRRTRLQQLQDITLAHILAGDTCSPIRQDSFAGACSTLTRCMSCSLAEFEAYLAYTVSHLYSGAYG